MENPNTLAALLREFSAGEIQKIEKIFVMDKASALPEIPPLISGKIVFYEDIAAAGKQATGSDSLYYTRMIAEIDPNDTVSIIYTSGTVGNPKGVILTHGNFLHNVRVISPLLHMDVEKGEKAISFLPIWHVYERAFEYCLAAGAMTIVYSGIRTLQEDLAAEKPELFASVPRLWETFYNRINAKMEKENFIKRVLFSFFSAINRAFYISCNYINNSYIFTKISPFLKFFGVILNAIAVAALYPVYLISKNAVKPVRDLFGGNLRASFSGGGSLPEYIDVFFNSSGVKLVNAYGLTETSPGSITRNLDRNTMGSIGTPLAEVQVKLLDKNNNPVALGEKGIIFIKGPNVMKGYYKNPVATAEVLSADGWLNTGDIAYESLSNDFVITGRAKSTIVLLGGENAEPEPIEEKLKESALIDHAVVVGQDKKGLTAVIALNEEKLRHLADKLKISFEDPMSKGGEIIMHSKIVREVQREIKRHVNRDTGFKPHEHITKFVLLKNKFNIGDELTQTLKVKRKHVEKKYRHLL